MKDINIIGWWNFIYGNSLTRSGYIPYIGYIYIWIWLTDTKSICIPYIIIYNVVYVDMIPEITMTIFL